MCIFTRAILGLGCTWELGSSFNPGPQLYHDHICRHQSFYQQIVVVHWQTSIMWVLHADSVHMYCNSHCESRWKSFTNGSWTARSALSNANLTNMGPLAMAFDCAAPKHMNTCILFSADVQPTWKICFGSCSTSGQYSKVHIRLALPVAGLIGNLLCTVCVDIILKHIIRGSGKQRLTYTIGYRQWTTQAFLTVN